MNTIRALLFVYGHKSGRVNWGEWSFIQLPVAGDFIETPRHGGGVNIAKVRHVEHKATRTDLSGHTPSAIVVTDWDNEFD